MLITKKELQGRDLHLRCDCMRENDPDVVYGTDAVFTVARAEREFTVSHVDRVKPPPLPDFEVFILGQPKLQTLTAADGTTTEVAVGEFSLRYKGSHSYNFTVQGATRAEFVANKVAKVEGLKTKVLEDEANLAKAQAIIGA